MTQKQLIRQEIHDELTSFVSTLAGFAGDLESLGSVRDGEDLRALAGEVERTYYKIRERHTRRRD